MSSSAAMARKRRANAPPQPPQPSQQSQVNGSPTSQQTTQSSSKGGFTINQAITLIDSRLKTLEDFKTIQETIIMNNKDGNPQSSRDTAEQLTKMCNHITQEYEERFTLLATEIHELKDMMLKLQSFTMEVNKTLMAERIEMMKSVNETLEDNKVEVIHEKSTFETMLETLKEDDSTDKTVTFA
jgi:viroplasmin and RNaseH domain-containing protein